MAILVNQESCDPLNEFEKNIFSSIFTAVASCTDASFVKGFKD